MWTRFQPKSTVDRPAARRRRPRRAQARVGEARLALPPGPDAPDVRPGTRRWRAPRPRRLLDLVEPVRARHPRPGRCDRPARDDRSRRPRDRQHGVPRRPGRRSPAHRPELDNRGAIYGTDARIIAERFLALAGITLHGPDGASLVYADPTGWTWREGLCWQAAAVAKHIADGLTEAPEHPLERSIAVMETIDAARAALESGMTTAAELDEADPPAGYRSRFLERHRMSSRTSMATRSAGRSPHPPTASTRSCARSGRAG